jgi:hypothetical protein
MFGPLKLPMAVILSGLLGLQGWCCLPARIFTTSTHALREDAPTCPHCPKPDTKPAAPKDQTLPPVNGCCCTLAPAIIASVPQTSMLATANALMGVAILHSLTPDLAPVWEPNDHVPLALHLLQCVWRC